jgi:hypothetical protein
MTFPVFEHLAATIITGTLSRRLLQSKEAIWRGHRAALFSSKSPLDPGRFCHNVPVLFLANHQP